MHYYDLVIAYGVTALHPLALVMLLICGVALLALPRRHAIWPIIIMTFFIAQGQRLVLMGLDFNLMRVMVIFGLLRVLIKNELFVIKRHKLDPLVFIFAITQALTHIIRTGDSDALIFELGQFLDIVGTYYVFRCLLQTWDDVAQAVKSMVILSVPLVVFFILESMTGRNMFSVFGGVPDITQYRQGRLRAQGAFSHPILAGVFFAVIMPLIAAQWWGKVSQRKWSIIGLLIAFVIVITTASSTPVCAVIAGLIGAVVFQLREQMHLIRWGVLTSLIFLHLIMKGPVWHLISRVSAVGGSTGYYRYELIDATINHFSEWWLVGTSSTAHWFWNATDLTNQIVKVCADGGILLLIIYISIITVAFATVGLVWRRERRDKPKVMMAWALGVSLFAMCMSFIGVAVWGQLLIIWYMLLAMIACIGNATDSASEKPIVLQADDNVDLIIKDIQERRRVT